MRKSGVVVGVDIGGTKIRAAVVGRGGRVGKEVEVPTDAKKGREAVISAVFAAISGVTSKKPAAIGMGVAGLVDHKKGMFCHGPNFSAEFSNVALAGVVRKKFGARTVIDNDVHCFTLAEAKFGSAKRFSRVVGLTIGTGIGGAMVVDKELVRGAHNAAGEFGHMTLVAEGGVPCSCGLSGHFEAYASGTAMQNLYHAQTGEHVLATEVEKRAKLGEDKAKAVVAQMTGMLSVGIANIVQSYDPDIVVIGGGLSRADIIFKPAAAGVPALIAFPELKKTPIVRATLGQSASVVGAALITNAL